MLISEEPARSASWRRSADLLIFYEIVTQLRYNLAMQDYKNKKVLIFGLGLNDGGVGSAKFFARQGAKVKVTDLKSAEILKTSVGMLKDFPDIEYTLGEHKYEDIDWADLVIKNPAVKPGNQYIEYAKKNGKKVLGDFGIFLEYVNPSRIIGVTGTKGKSTTASLIYEILKTEKDNVVFAGNIGKSVLETIEHITPETLVVLEISSFHLEDFELKKVSPKYAVITNIYPDHLNYYKNMDEYIAAKKIIGQFQTKEDFLFLRKDDPETTKPEFLNQLKGQLIYFSNSDLPADFQPKLPGSHNRENMAAALKVAEKFEIDQQKALEIIASFSGVPFRMQLIKELSRIKIYNDTAATGPDAAIAAMKTLPRSIVIAGGMNKNMDYTEYLKVLQENAKEVFFLEGDSTDIILSSLRAERSNLPIHGPYNNLETLLEEVKKVTKHGDTILFSPGATSFNLFQNEFDRGRKFNEAVEKVFP
jgi:UDP-N-acetylmuramoylalanine--D-glutamate ligase